MKDWTKSSRNRIILALGILLLIAAVLLNLCLGSAGITLPELYSAVFHRGEAGMAGNIFWLVRLPRTTAAFAAGAGLALSGAILQSVLANPLASPNIIGVNAGAGLGVTLFAALNGYLGAKIGTLVFSGLGYALCAFAGSLFAVLLVTTIAAKTGASKSTVILGGVALNSILNAVTESISVLDKDVAALNADFRVGGFSGVSFTRVIPGSILILAGFLIIMTLRNELDVMTLGDESARSVGLNVRRYRFFFIVIAALLAGASVSFAGLLGFVGLIIPHFIRRIAGNENRWLIPLSAVYGGAFVLFCDLGARMLFAPFELPVGIILALLGGPCFVMVLLKEKGGHRNG